MTAPANASRIWLTQRRTIMVQLIDGQEFEFQPTEPSRLVAFLQNTAPHAAWREFERREAEVRWRQAAERKGAEIRAQEEARKAKAEAARSAKLRREMSQREAIKLLEEVGL